MTIVWIKRRLKTFPVLVNLKRRLSRIVDPILYRSELRTINDFPVFAPNSGGSFKDRTKLTVQAANQTFPFISKLIESITNVSFEEPVPIEAFANSENAKSAATKLKLVFDKYGSDKATVHGYHYLYGYILENPDAISDILEIGIGTNNTDVVSNMGVNGRPGASLRAFSEFLPHATLFGADVDRRILFQEHKIKTVFVDQTELGSFDSLAAAVDRKFDLIIDDGLHSPNANIASLIFACNSLKQDGWFVVEDISLAALPVWHVVSTLLPSDYRSWIIAAKGAVVFAVQRRRLIPLSQGDLNMVSCQG